MKPIPFTILSDTRDPWPHPYSTLMPSHVTFERFKLDTGDLCVKGMESEIVVERKSSDFLSAMAAERRRFEAELERAKSLKRMVIVVERGMADLEQERRCMEWNAIVGTMAAWVVDYPNVSIMLSGNERHAAHFVYRLFNKQVERDVSNRSDGLKGETNE